MIPVEIAGGAAAAAERLGGDRSAPLPAPVLHALEEAGIAVSTDPAERAEAGRDWWPVSIGWAVHGQTPARPAAVARPTDARQVAAALAACSAAGVPVTPAAGRSGVCGGVVPVFGGLVLDLTGLGGPVEVDDESLVAEVPAGTPGPALEAALRTGGHTLGHWPQSMALSTVGGWIACRSAGQYSTRYGKIEDMVAGLEFVLPDGSVVVTGRQAPRAATGPNLTQLFVGSEGVLGVITRAWLRVHPVPAAEERRAFAFDAFADGLDACRRILRRGATPAVLRLYDRVESARSFTVHDRCVLIVVDEADPFIVEATMRIVEEECRQPLDASLADHWLATRNDVSRLTPLWAAGVVVDTVEVAAHWAALPELTRRVVAALEVLDGTLAASVHQSHAYLDGACVYFTFAGHRPDAAPEWQEAYYRDAWAAVIAVVEQLGGAISHHHGIGLNRSRFMAGALGGAHRVLGTLKQALDPSGIMNPGKLGLASPYGEVPCP